jgi:hypothetical protein
MRKLITLLALILLSFKCFAPTCKEIAIIKSEPIIYDSTLLAIMKVESNFNPNAINYDEDAVGCLQIRPVMLNEVNRIQKELGRKEFFELKDRLDSTKSVKMYYIVQNYYNPTGDSKFSARLWNGGTIKYIPQTEEYWNKVKKLI